MLKMNEIEKWDEKTIQNKVKDLRGELFKMKMQKSTSGVEKPHRIDELKKDIARLLTVQNRTREE